MLFISNSQDLREFVKEKQEAQCWTIFFATKLVEKFTYKGDNSGCILLIESPIWKSSSRKETDPNTMIIKVLSGDRTEVVIECKTCSYNFEEIEDDIKEYMRSLECRNGIIMSVDKAVAFRVIDDDNVFPSEVMDLSERGNLYRLTNFVNEA